MWCAGSSVRLEIFWWTDKMCKTPCQIRVDVMGRYGVEGVLSEPPIGPIGFVWNAVDLEAFRWADIWCKKSYKISKNTVMLSGVAWFLPPLITEKLPSLPSPVKWSRYRPDMPQRVGRDIALLFHDRGTRRGWVVSSTPRPQFTPGKDPVPILQEAGWAPGPVWTGRKSRPHRDSIPDRPARSQSLYWLSCRAHLFLRTTSKHTSCLYKFKCNLCCCRQTATAQDASQFDLQCGFPYVITFESVGGFPLCTLYQ